MGFAYMQPASGLKQGISDEVLGTPFFASPVPENLSILPGVVKPKQDAGAKVLIISRNCHLTRPPKH